MLAEEVLNITQSSKSKSRRQRATAVRSQLWKSLQSSRSGEAVTNNDALLSGILSKLTFMESLVFDVHWAAIGQWQGFNDIDHSIVQEYNDAILGGDPTSSIWNYDVPRLAEKMLEWNGSLTDLEMIDGMHSARPQSQRLYSK